MEDKNVEKSFKNFLAKLVILTFEIILFPTIITFAANSEIPGISTLSANQGGADVDGKYDIFINLWYGNLIIRGGLLMKGTKIISCITMAALMVIAVGITTNVKAETIKEIKPVTEMAHKNVVTYFPNWAMYNSAHQSMEPKDIPWTKVNVINHSFFSINKDFKITSIDTYADYEKTMEHSGGWDSPLKGCLGEYKYYKGIYPDKKILISVGGWTRGENFHAMAMTAETRKVFTDSVVEFLKQYPFIDGIDIDWEYPGVDRKAEPNDQYDKGCPGGPEDKVNYTLLLKDIRDAYNANGLSGKMLTVAAGAGYDKMALVEPSKYEQYLDYMNVMTYDIHGAWELTTNHQAALYVNPEDPSGTTQTDLKNKYNSDYAMKAYRDIYKISPSKLNMGSPLYSRGWKGVKPGPNGDGLYQSATGASAGSLDNASSPGGQEPWFILKQLETTPGWNKYYDTKANAVYLYNASKGEFLTYEDEKTLSDRCDYVNANGYGGVFIWDASDDDLSKGSPMTTIAWNKMSTPVVNKLQAATLTAGAVSNGAYKLTAIVPANNTATSYTIMEGAKTITNGTLVAGQTTTQTIVYDSTGKEPGTYDYIVELSDGTKSITSNQVTVIVLPPVVNKLQAATLTAGAVSNGAYKLTATVPINNTATSYAVMEGTKQLTTGKLVVGQTTTQAIVYDSTDKAPGTYDYTVVVTDGTSSLISNKVSVTVPKVVGKLPAKPSLTQDNWDSSSDYKIIMNMWWGENGTSWRLYENGVLISTKPLVASVLNAQTDSVSFKGKARGTYVYKAELVNDAGITVSDEFNYTVR
ncbi:glycosyl hydrolase family 18 protein [Clostridium sp. CF011]|uniref:glycosyl hydrolase family 18 protein n=1 Tax=Clostridium sp. CF011 TaxID=2843318 RepID=UPI00209B80CF|nr:glycosyl hydrolase family 18 protein [Clostridium sp. CF011]WAG71333.1 glycoside hydrolase [Clostridium sp. CF011]